MLNKPYVSIRTNIGVASVPFAEVDSFMRIEAHLNPQLMNATPVVVNRQIRHIPDDELDEFLRRNYIRNTGVGLYNGDINEYNNPFDDIPNLRATVEPDKLTPQHVQEERQRASRARQREHIQEKAITRYEKKYGGDASVYLDEQDRLDEIGMEHAMRGYEHASNHPYWRSLQGGFTELFAGVYGLGEAVYGAFGGDTFHRFSIADRISAYNQGVGMYAQEELSFLGKSWSGFLQSAPITAAAIATAGKSQLASALVMGLPSTGSKYVDIKRRMDLNYATIVGNSLISGGIEA